jgi:hypothetical protein
VEPDNNDVMENRNSQMFWGQKLAAELNRCPHQIALSNSAFKCFQQVLQMSQQGSETDALERKYTKKHSPQSKNLLGYYSF